MGKVPCILWPPKRERQQPMAYKVLWRLRGIALLQITRACHKLMAVGQNSARHQRRVLQFTNSKGQVHAFGDLIDDAVGDEDMHADVRVRRLEGSDDRRE